MRLCSGCGTKIPAGRTAARCKSCRAERIKPDDGIKQHGAGYDAAIDALRKDKRYQKIRAMVAAQQPFCQECKAAPTEIVDHVIPAEIAIQQARESGRWPYSPNEGFYMRCNLQGLCRSCHKRKTDRDKTHVGEWPSVIEAFDRAPKRKWSF